MTTENEEHISSHPEAFQLPYYVAGTLSQSERDALERHLQQCPECQEELAEEQFLQPVIQKAFQEWPKPSKQGLRRVKEKIALESPRKNQFSAQPQIAELNWATQWEQWIRQLFLPRWVPTFAVLLLCIQGSTLLFLMQSSYSPSSDRPPGMEGPIFERDPGIGIPRAPTNQKNFRIKFSPELSLGAVQTLLSKVEGTIINGPLKDGEYVISLPYKNEEHLKKIWAVLKSGKGVQNVELWDH